MKPISLFMAFVILVCTRLVSFAQCDTISLAHDSLQFVVGARYSNTDPLVLAMEKYNDTVYLGGEFGYVGRFTGGFVRLNAGTGALDNPVTWPAVDGGVRQAIPDGSGGFIIVGSFLKVGDSLRKNIAHINGSGQVSPFKVTVDLVGGDIYCALLHNGILYIGGSFDNINGQARNDLAAINFPTGLLTTWNPNPNASVYTLATDGTNIYIGGAFTQVGSATRNRVAAVSTSGTLQAWNPNVNGGIQKIIVSNNKVYIGGNFNLVGATTRNHIAAIDKATGIATTWNGNSSGQVETILLHGARLYVAGAFITIGGQNRNWIASLDTVTGAATSWAPTVDFAVYELEANGASIYAGGIFGNAGGSKRNGIAAIDTTTGLATTFAPVTYNGAQAETFINSGSHVYVGGFFASVGGEYRNGLAAIDVKKYKLLTWAPDLPNKVTALKVNNGKLYVGGDFATVNSVSRWHLARFNLSNYSLDSWNPFVSVAGPQVTDVRSLEVAGNFTYVAGKINIFSNGTHDCIVRLNNVTDAIDPWSPTMYGTNIHGNAVKVWNNYVYIGGKFDNASNTSAGMMRYDLVNNTVHYYNLNDEVTDLMLYLNFKLYAAGKFTNVNGSTNRNYLAAFDLNTNALAAWNPVQTMLTFSATRLTLAADKHKLYLTGEYGHINGMQRRPATIDTGHALMMSGWRPDVSAKLTLPIGDTLLVAGGFSNVNGHRLMGLARFHLNYPATPSASVSTTVSPLCESINTTFNASSNIPNVQSYQWQLNGAAAGSNSPNYTYAPANGDQLTSTVNIAPTGSNCYMVTRAASSVYTVNATPSTTPTISIMVTSNNICVGTVDTFLATTNITGGSFQWTANGSNIGTNADQLIYTPANGDVVACEIIVPGTGCYTAISALSNSITMIVDPKITPTISLAGPASGIQGSSITINATVADAGTTYSIEWSNNGSPFATTGVPTVSYVKTSGNDVITAVISPIGCYNAATSAAHSVQDVTGIKDVLSLNNIEIYPNPFEKQLSIKGLHEGDMVVIYSVLGNVVLQAPATKDQSNNLLVPTGELASGSYLIEVLDKNKITKGRRMLHRL